VGYHSGLGPIEKGLLCSLSFESISVVGDYLCDVNSRGKLRTNQEITWGQPDIFVEALEEEEIDADFLRLVTDATDYSKSLYGDTLPKRLLVSHLKELQSRQVRSELLQCY